MIKFWMDRLVRVGIILLIAFVVSGTLSQANARRVGLDAGEFIERYKVTLDSIGDMLEHVRQGDLNYSNGYCAYESLNSYYWKSRVRLTPDDKMRLTPGNNFVLTL